MKMIRQTNQQLFIIFAFLNGIGLVPSKSYAEDRLKITGFGTIGYSHLLNSKGGETFDQETLKYKDKKTKEYMAISNKGTFSRDTRFGLNLDVPLDKNNLFLTAQIYSESSDLISGVGKNFETKLSLLNLNYSPSNGTTIRAGLLRIPIWFISEEKLAGYTYPFIRNPTEVDAAHVHGDSITGISVSKVFELGNLTVRPTLTGGTIDYNIANSARNSTRVDAQGLFATTRFEYGDNLIMSLGCHGLTAIGISDTTIESKINGYNLLIEQTLQSDVTLKEYVADLKYESNNLLVMSEAFTQMYRVRDSSFKPLKNGEFNVRGGYLLLGIPVQKWLFRATVSHHRTDFNVSDNAISDFIDLAVNQNPSIPNEYKPYAGQSIAANGNEILKAVLNTKIVQSSLILGTNYQWKTNVVFKLELQRSVSPSDASAGLLGLNRGGAVNLVSSSVDFVY